MNENLIIQLPDGTNFEMIYVAGGEFMMGSKAEDQDARDNEKPAHRVKLSSFYIGRYPVTQEVWRAVAENMPDFKLEKEPSRFKGNTRPVEQVSWEDIDQQFLPALNKLTGKNFGLPTEAQWEYAARGGIYWEEEYIYAGSDKLKEVGWYNENSENETKPVGRKQANQLGIYDLSGNVWEWCQDWLDNAFYQKCFDQGIVSNPLNSHRAQGRVLRGGGYFTVARFCRVALRHGFRPGDRNAYFGFRLALQFSEESSKS